jgi:hypothetical protein
MESNLIEPHVIRGVIAQAKKLGADLDNCFWVSDELVVEAFKNAQTRTEKKKATGTMCGMPVVLTEWLTRKAVLLDQSGKAWATVGLE